MLAAASLIDSVIDLGVRHAVTAFSQNLERDFGLWSLGFYSDLGGTLSKSHCILYSKCAKVCCDNI